ncbi:unnamed protein product [Paramecium sonneborni]|uniref:Uncharacterized protein n=1 Tax=Paramecium sonneborni TaxID=65129 RepID=A0A8S1KTQ7_9CILI|nr:unnamed protein product [Paramecium sonneborni]
MFKTRKNCEKSFSNNDFQILKQKSYLNLKSDYLFDNIFINPKLIVQDQIENLIIQFPAQIDYSQLPQLLNINQLYQNNSQNKSSILFIAYQELKKYMLMELMFKMLFITVRLQTFQERNQDQYQQFSYKIKKFSQKRSIMLLQN